MPSGNEARRQQNLNITAQSLATQENTVEKISRVVIRAYAMFAHAAGIPNFAPVYSNNLTTTTQRYASRC